MFVCRFCANNTFKLCFVQHLWKSLLQFFGPSIASLVLTLFWPYVYSQKRPSSYSNLVIVNYLWKPLKAVFSLFYCKVYSHLDLQLQARGQRLLFFFIVFFTGGRDKVFHDKLLRSEYLLYRSLIVVLWVSQPYRSNPHVMMLCITDGMADVIKDVYAPAER